jgi:hypothetical protein
VTTETSKSEFELELLRQTMQAVHATQQKDFALSTAYLGLLTVVLATDHPIHLLAPDPQRVPIYVLLAIFGVAVNVTQLYFRGIVRSYIRTARH